MDPSKPKTKLSFGLNKAQLPRQPLKQAFKSKSKPFEDEDDEPILQQPPIASTSKGTGISTSKLSKQQRLKQEQELELDQSAYEYDEVYDQMKSAEKNAQALLKEESSDRKPKYIAKLMESSELRKQDRLRAEDKMIAKEREREGDEFKDKDQFVTPGYLKQQEEMRRVEQEEKRLEEMNAGKKGGMTSFYKQYLDKTSKTHEAAVLASQQPTSSSSSSSAFTISAPPPPTEKEKTDVELAKEFEAKSGKKVELNDDGEIMDKRQLMSGGLNLVKKKLGPQLPGSGGGFSLPISARKEQQERSKDGDGEEEGSMASLLHPGQSAEERRRAMRERQSREIERQMVELEKKRKRDQEESEKGRVEKVQKRRNDETKVEELKRKAEERRKKREQEMKDSKE